jgi:hypothetical protein
MVGLKQLFGGGLLPPLLGYLSLAVVAFAPALATATQAVRLSQSLENPAAESETEERSEPLNQAAVQVEPELKLAGDRVTPEVASKPDVAAHLTDQVLRIYDARTLLSYDDDGDGFYHRLEVTFDADVDHGDAFVYARLYLSYEGGPWNLYFTTNVFHILEDVSYDDYAVETRLLEGYPTGYYDILIELYDADWDEHVASYGPYEDGALRALPLEDLQRDTLGYDEGAYPVSDSHGGGGGIGLLGLLLLGGWRFFARSAVTSRVRGMHEDKARAAD